MGAFGRQHPAAERKCYLLSIPGPRVGEPTSIVSERVFLWIVPSRAGHFWPMRPEHSTQKINTPQK